MKWIGECPKCNKRFHRARRTNIACGPCCKKYNNDKYTPKYKIEWELNKKVIRHEY